MLLVMPSTTFRLRMTKQTSPTFKISLCGGTSFVVYFPRIQDLSVCVYICVIEKKRVRERQRDKDRERERQRERKKERENTITTDH